MNIRRLESLLQCSKYCEFSEVILQKENLKEHIFQNLLMMTARAIQEQAVWSTFEKELRNYAQTQYKEEWYELHWQKKADIEKNIYLLNRGYCWLQSNINGKLLSVNHKLYIPFCMQYGRYDISEIDVCANFIVETRKGEIWGILLCRKFPKPYTYHAQKTGNSIYHSMEMLCLMAALQYSYPEKKIQVSMIQVVSRKDTTHSFAIFEHYKGDNVMSFTTEDLKKQKMGSALEVLKGLFQNPQRRNCNNCCYRELCTVKETASEQYFPSPVKRVLHQPVYTDNQLRVIRHMSGPLRVCAGPGSGKTETLVARIQNLIDYGIMPEKILAVTFTKKATQEIRYRINSEKLPVVSTLHALAFQIIRQHQCLIGRKRLVNQTDCKKMLLEILQCAPVIAGADYENLTGCYGLIDNLMDDFRFIGKFGKERFSEAYPDKDIYSILLIKSMYDQKFSSSGFIRFDDLIYLAVKLLEKYPGVHAKMRDMFEYIMIDEVQDLDEMQGHLIKLLVKDSEANIAIFGDADQSIYGFRGGSNRFMLDFPKTFPGTVDVCLEDNFRSSSEILETANLLISHNHDRIPIRMNAFFETGCQPELLTEFRVNRMGLLIEDLLQQGYHQEDIAIIARKNKSLSGICDILSKYNEEHSKESVLCFARPKNYLYQSPVYQTVLDLLTLHQGHFHEDAVWYRLLVRAGIQIEKKYRNKSIYENLLLDKSIYPFHGEEASRYLVVGAEDSKLLQEMAKIYRISRLFFLPAALAVPKVLQEYYADEIFEEELDALNTIIHDRSIKDAHDLWEYMDAAKLFRDDMRIYRESFSKSQLHLLTAHDAKGKEFKVVILYGIDEFELDNLQEDRRLLYVALTRAKEKVILTETYKGKSCFVKELEAHLLRKGGLRYA